ncbi:uncharacterized protein LOC127254869 [Andrographis paniculata]|uniref:uncharacterized protein LOC127254869 n=1 Tax=Andrographis paniculata TaxID=175694 RepID=UPI0021E91E49|nr:uncharacterized protein LOC127254869 [Andrographis paniculata]
MPAVCFSLKKTLHCKSEPSDVQDPTAQKQLPRTSSNAARSGCSRSIANLKDVVIHGSKRHPDPPPNCSPRSIGSADFLNPITHQVFLTTSNREIRYSDASMTPSPGTPCTRTPTSKRSSSSDHDFNNYAVVCRKCGDHFRQLDALESHHFSRHAVTELVDGDSSRKIVEIIFRSSWTTTTTATTNSGVRIERILKIHNTPATLSRFEDHRDAVKARAAALPKKHSRCLADGNELLRFHGASLSCSLGAGTAGVCASEKCSVCGIIRQGFSGRERGGVGVFTASTSGRAYDYESAAVGDGARKALVVCRVIAGRVRRPVGGGVSLAGFDSLAGKVGAYANIEELYLLDPKALLPCFVVVCKNS